MSSTTEAKAIPCSVARFFEGCKPRDDSHSDFQHLWQQVRYALVEAESAPLVWKRLEKSAARRGCIAYDQPDWREAFVSYCFSYFEKPPFMTVDMHENRRRLAPLLKALRELENACQDMGGVDFWFLLAWLQYDVPGLKHSLVALGVKDLPLLASPLKDDDSTRVHFAEILNAWANRVQSAYDRKAEATGGARDAHAMAFSIRLRRELSGRFGQPLNSVNAAICESLFGGSITPKMVSEWWRRSSE